MSSAQEKANLARIRDNQRRSRARRKEYLQELEARLRQCELQGIEASAEIQMAARKVADENKKLRGLLAQHGIGDDSVETYLQATDPVMVGQYGSNSGAVQNLENLLMRKPISPVGVGCGVQPLAMGRGPESRSSSASVSTMQSLWDTRGQRISGKDTSGAHQFMTPSSTSSRNGSVNLSHGSSHPLPPHQQGLASVTMACNHSPSPSVARPAPSPQFDFDPQLLYAAHSSYNNKAQQHLQPHSQTQRPSIYVPTTISTADGSSCLFATDMISTMTGADPQSVSAELGCMPDMDCEVDNHLVFDVMDRYSGGNGL